MKNYDKSLQNYQEALNIISKLGFEAMNPDIQNSLEWSKKCHDKDEIIDEQIDYVSTIQSYIESIQLYKNQFNQDLSRIGPITESIKYFNLLYYGCYIHNKVSYSKLVNVYKKLKEDEYESLKKINYIGLLVDNIVDISTKLDNFIRVINLFEEALKLCNEDDPRIAKCYLRIGELCQNKKQLSQAEQNYSNALKIFQKESKRHSSEIYNILEILIQINSELASFEKSKRDMAQATKRYTEAILNCKECLKIHQFYLNDPFQQIFKGFSRNEYSSELEVLYKKFALLCKEFCPLITNSPYDITYYEVVTYFEDFLITNKQQFTSKLQIASFYIDICKWYGLHLNNNDDSRQACLEKGLEIIQNYRDNNIFFETTTTREMLKDIHNYLGFNPH